MSREVVFEVVCIGIELTNHVINFVNVGLKIVLLALYPFVPDHCELSLDVSLSFICVAKHLKVGSSELARQYH